MKATTKAATTTTTEAAQAVKLSANVKTLVAAYFKADTTAQAAITSRDQTLLKLAKAIAQNAGEVDALKASLVPMWMEAYGVKKDAEGKWDKSHPKFLYSGQQLSRLFSVVKGLRDEKRAKQIEKAEEKGLKWNDLLTVATGAQAFDKKGELQKVKTDNRGGSNRSTPLESFRNAINNAVTAANTAKLDLLPVFNSFVDALKACEMITEDEAQTLSDACEEIA